MAVQVAAFVTEHQQTGDIPRPGDVQLVMGGAPYMQGRAGDVQLVMGGPPCQGVSGYNRHRDSKVIYPASSLRVLSLPLSFPSCPLSSSFVFLCASLCLSLSLKTKIYYAHSLILCLSLCLTHIASICCLVSGAVVSSLCWKRLLHTRTHRN